MMIESEYLLLDCKSHVHVNSQWQRAFIQSEKTAHFQPRRPCGVAEVTMVSQHLSSLLTGPSARGPVEGSVSSFTFELPKDNTSRELTTVFVHHFIP